MADRAHVSGASIRKALDTANLNPASETFVQDFAEVVSGVAGIEARNAVAESAAQNQAKVDAARLVVFDPDLEADRILSRVRGR